MVILAGPLPFVQQGSLLPVATTSHAAPTPPLRKPLLQQCVLEGGTHHQKAQISALQAAELGLSPERLLVASSDADADEWEDIMEEMEDPWMREPAGTDDDWTQYAVTGRIYTQLRWPLMDSPPQKPLPQRAGALPT